MTLRGHPRSLILAPIESTYGTSYSSSIVTLVQSYLLLEILQFFYADSHFCPHLTHIPAKILGVPLEYIHGVWVYREWTPSANQPEFQCDHDTSTLRTDGQIDNLPLPRCA